MLIRIIASLASTMPWKPTLPLFPASRPLGVPDGPPMLPESLCALLPARSPPVLPGREPHWMLSRCSGLCTTGELCTLMPGLTARRLKLTGSRSSSRRRLLLMRRVISAAEGGCGPMAVPCDYSEG